MSVPHTTHGVTGTPEQFLYFKNLATFLNGTGFGGGGEIYYKLFLILSLSL
jgi:hypothetical protein